MDICSAQYGLCGYSFLDGSYVNNSPKNGRSSNDSRILVGRRNINGNFDCHGYPVLDIELQSKSLGQHHHRRNKHFCRCNWRTRSLLRIFCNCRGCGYATNYLVCLEVETIRCAQYQLIFSGLKENLVPPTCTEWT